MDGPDGPNRRARRPIEDRPDDVDDEPRRGTSRASGLIQAARSRPMIAVAVAAVVVVLLGVAGTALIRRVKSPDKVDTIAAGEHLAAVLDRVARDGSTVVDGCPLPDLAQVLESAPAPLRPDGWSADGMASGYSDEQRRSITCTADGDRLIVDSLKLGAVVGEPRTLELRAALTSAAGERTIKFANPFKTQGGDALAACVSPKDQQIVDYCVVAYNSTNLAIDLIAGGSGATTEAMTTWLNEAFPAIIAAIESAPLESSTTSSTPTSSSSNSTSSTSVSTSIAPSTTDLAPPSPFGTTNG